jgi:hypothetical protein
MNALNFLASICAAITIIGVIFAILVLHRFAKKLEKQEEKRHKITVKEECNHNVEVQKIICRIKIQLNATKVIIARFHNGGNYVNGLEMKKFSTTFETEGGTYIPMMDKCVSVFNSRYPIAFSYLAAMGYYTVAERKDCEDGNFRNDMKEFDFQSTNLFLMKNFDGLYEGFIGVNFRDSRVMDKEAREKVTDEIPQIVGLLNMDKKLR